MPPELRDEPDFTDPENNELQNHVRPYTEEEKKVLRAFPTAENMIGIWGMRQSGKTTFVVSLYSLLTQARDLGYRWTITGCDIVTENWAAVRASDMHSRGLFPLASQAGLEKEPFFFYNFNLRPANYPAAEPAFTFSYLDIAGELYDSQTSQLHNVDTPVNYLSNCKGILFLIDPLWGNTEKDIHELNQVISQLFIKSGRTPIRIPMYFVITKCDILPHRVATQSEADAREALRNVQPLLPSFIEARVANPRYFGASAIGFKEGEPPNLFQRFDGRVGIKDPRAIQGVNVVEVFEALVDDILRPTP